MFYPIVAAAVFATDYIAKKKVNQCLQDGQEKEIFCGHIVLKKRENKGLAGNFLEENPDIVKKIAMLMCGVVGICWIKAIVCRKHPVKKLGLSFLLGGGLMNLYERCENGAVTDYFTFKKKSGAKCKLCFNLSDLFIFLGSILSLVDK